MKISRFYYGFKGAPHHSRHDLEVRHWLVSFFRKLLPIALAIGLLLCFIGMITVATRGIVRPRINNLESVSSATRISEAKPFGKTSTQPSRSSR